MPTTTSTSQNNHNLRLLPGRDGKSPITVTNGGDGIAVSCPAVEYIIRETYGCDACHIKAPSGYEFTAEFCRGEYGQPFLPLDHKDCPDSVWTAPAVSPRLILRKKRQVVGEVYRIVVGEMYRIVGPRRCGETVKSGEFYRPLTIGNYNDRNFYFAASDFRAAYDLMIFSMECIYGD